VAKLCTSHGVCAWFCSRSSRPNPRAPVLLDPVPTGYVLPKCVESRSQYRAFLTKLELSRTSSRLSRQVTYSGACSQVSSSRPGWFPVIERAATNTTLLHMVCFIFVCALICTTQVQVQAVSPHFAGLLFPVRSLAQWFLATRRPASCSCVGKFETQSSGPVAVVRAHLQRPRCGFCG
jgi:hypothetical protein